MIRHTSPNGEIGRRSRLKICRWKHRAGSIPAPGTIRKQFIDSTYSALKPLFRGFFIAESAPVDTFRFRPTP